MCYLCLNYSKIPFDSEHNIVPDEDEDGWRDIGDGIGALTLEQIEKLPKWNDLPEEEKLRQYEEAEKAVDELRGVASRTIKLLEDTPPFDEKIKQAEEDLDILRRNYSKTLSYLVSNSNATFSGSTEDVSSPSSTYVNPDPPSRANWWGISTIAPVYEDKFLGQGPHDTKSDIENIVERNMRKDENEKKKHKGKKKEKHTKR